MAQFLEMLRESVILQATITLLLIGTVCYLFITHSPIPEFLQSLTALVVGFYFGAKVQALVHKAGS